MFDRDLCTEDIIETVLRVIGYWYLNTCQMLSYLCAVCLSYHHLTNQCEPALRQ